MLTHHFDADAGSDPHPLPAGQWIEVEGVPTRYFEAGAGTPMVLIYGGNFGSPDSASSAYTWAVNIAALSRHYRVIAPDKLGQGETGNPKRDDDYTMAAVVDHMAAFMRALRLPAAHVVGHSRGGYVATRLTLEHHELVRSLTIVNSGTLSPGVGLNEVVLCNPPYPKGTHDCARWVYENYCHKTSAVTRHWIDAVIRTMNQDKYKEAVRKMTVQGLNDGLFLPQLAGQKRETLQWLREGRLQRPVQVIWGFNDRTALLERGLELFQMVAEHDRLAQLHVVNDAGHFPFREHPEQFNALLTRFASLHD